MIGGDMEQLSHQTEPSQTTGYIVDIACLMVSHLAVEPPFCVIIGALGPSKGTSCPLHWLGGCSIVPNSPFCLPLTSSHCTLLVRLVHHLPLLKVIVDVMIQ